MSSTNPSSPSHQPPPTSTSTSISTTPESQSQSQSQLPSNPPNTRPGGTAPFLRPTTLLIRFRNFYHMATGSMSPQGQAAYWADADLRYEALDCRRCESDRDHLLQYSPVIRYLRHNIESLGGKLDASNIRCRRCEPHERMEGGFDPRYGIKLCANVLEGRGRIEDTLAHEMVHAWDHLRWRVDWGCKGGDLKGVACTEIRASSLSGECRWSNEFFGNKIFKFANQHQNCVRRRAVQSVRSRPQCKSDLAAVKAVNEVWESCFSDTRPFDEIYR